MSSSKRTMVAPDEVKFPPEARVQVHLAGDDAQWYRLEPGTKGRVVAVHGDRGGRVVELASGERVVLSIGSLEAAPAR